MEKYYVSDGNGAKEVNIPQREDAFKSILGASNSPKNEENTQPNLVAGDAVVEASNAVFEGKEESVIVEPPAKETFYCSNCRKHYSDEEVRKEAIDYQRNEDGTLSKSASRFSVFCKVCAKFFRVIDNDAAKMLKDMVRKNVRN